MFGENGKAALAEEQPKQSLASHRGGRRRIDGNKLQMFRMCLSLSPASREKPSYGVWFFEPSSKTSDAYKKRAKSARKRKRNRKNPRQKSCEEESRSAAAVEFDYEIEARCRGLRPDSIQRFLYLFMVINNANRWNVLNCTAPVRDEAMARSSSLAGRVRRRVQMAFHAR